MPLRRVTRKLRPHSPSSTPGTTYVDWTCLDGFNWASNGVNRQPWRSFDEIFASSYRTITRRIAPTKPMVLGRVRLRRPQPPQGDWIDQMFTELRTTYRRIRGVIWFEQIDRGVKWPIESSPKVTDSLPPRDRRRRLPPQPVLGPGRRTRFRRRADPSEGGFPF